MKTFFAIASVLAAIAAVVLLTRPSEPPPPEPTTSPDTQLTEAEAIARFTELESLEEQAYAKADPELLESIYTANSPVQDKAIRDIRKLQKDGVTAHFIERTEDAELRANSSSEIRVEQSVVFDLVFRDQSGRDLTQRGGFEEQVLEWILHLDNGQWLVYDVVIEEADRP